MKRMYGLFVLILLTGCHYVKSPEMRLCSRLDWHSITHIFPKNIQQIESMKQRSIDLIESMLQTLSSQDPQSRNFHNCIRVYDNAKFKFIMNLQILSVLAMLSDDADIRYFANDAVIALQKYQTDTLARNPILLHAFQEYAQHGYDDQSKTVSVRTFLQKAINQLEHEGAQLSFEKRDRLNGIAKEIRTLEAEFVSHIRHHSGVIQCTIDELPGLSPDYIDSLLKSDAGYQIPLTYDSFFMVLENCTHAQTRKKMFLAFNQRVYQQNGPLLKKLVDKRNEYAQMVGYKNFAEYECALQMVGSLQRAESFIYDVIASTNTLVAQEFTKIKKDLPPSVSLTAQGKLQPFDEAFVRSYYRKKHFDLDEAVIAQYFTIDHVLDEIKKQFGQFFGLSFEPLSNHGLWHQDLVCLQVRLLKTSEIIGYLIFDLYARPGKSEQASQISVIPALQDDCNFSCSGLSTIVTYFNKSSGNHPTLLSYHDVKILLHEFGHGLQELFGATDFVDLAGSKGPRDFIEVPSQLFEMWMNNPYMIKSFSKHYKTGKPLSDSMIEKIIAAEKFGKASLLIRQCLLSLLSLELGKVHHDTTIHDIVGTLYQKVRIDVAYCPEDYFETGFEHLVSYGSHYYSYVWSEVLAAGLFDYIEKEGITDYKVGQNLYQILLSHGGSKDPQILIEHLLGGNITKQPLLDSLQK